jgi:hypothetical protein
MGAHTITIYLHTWKGSFLNAVATRTRSSVTTAACTSPSSVSVVSTSRRISSRLRLQCATSACTLSIVSTRGPSGT